jgi:hypothetical protein
MPYETDTGSTVSRPESAAAPNDTLSPRPSEGPDAPVWKVAEAAQQAGQQAKDAAVTIASTANEIAKGLINQQIAAGCQWIGQMADSTRGAAQSLEKDFPEFAGLLRQASDKVEAFSKELPDRSVDDLYRSVAEFHRQQPVVLFGAAAVLGFFAYRLFKNSAPQVGTGATDL